MRGDTAATHYSANPFTPYLKEAQFLFAVRHQHVLGLPVVVQHHLMRFPAKAGLLLNKG